MADAISPERPVRSASRPLTADDVGDLAAIPAILLGTWIRLFAPWSAGFPINDGGLFLRALEALSIADYQLPESISYNGLDIPFAYPPLGFYFGAAVADILHQSHLFVLQWLPAVVASATILAYYWLARLMLPSRFAAGMATFLFALAPRAVWWMVMGGGLTRSLGQLLLIVMVGCLYRLMASGSRSSIAATAVVGSALVLTHPEAALHAFLAAAILFLVRSRKAVTAGRFALNALIIAAITSIWWGTVLLRHGFEPFSTALATRHLGGAPPLRLLVAFDISNEPFTALIAMLGLLGAFLQFARREFWLTAWMILPFFIESRNAANVAVIPLTLLGAVALADFILPELARRDVRHTSAIADHLLRSRSAQLFAAFVSISLLFGAWFQAYQLAQNAVSRDNRRAMEWIRLNTPPDSTFLVVTGDTCILCDATKEWFPVLADRASITTVQGREWLNGEDLERVLRATVRTDQCTNRDLTCLAGATDEFGLQYDYVYISHRVLVRGGQIMQSISSGYPLLFSLLSDPQESYQLVYKSDEVSILRVETTAAAP